MLFTIKRPKSERFFQLSFNGFTPRGRNRIERYLNTVSEFLGALFGYLRKRLTLGILYIGKLFLLLAGLTVTLKAFITRKLIWSRGRLGRSVATFAVMTAAFAVFLLGEVFNSSRLVNSQEISRDYLRNVSDIIPPKNIAMTSIPESRRTESVVYVVEGGDTLYGIGEKFKVSTDAIKYVNSLTDYSVLKPGQEITIPPVIGLVHKVATGDSLQSIANKYEVPSQAIADFNYILDTSKLAVGTELVIPGAKVPETYIAPPTVATAFTPPTATVVAPTGKGWCMWPTSVRIVTQYFSWYHNGVDIATSWGSSMPPLYACSSGNVSRAGWDPFGLGLHVRVTHNNGYETVYGHMSKINVSYGEKVDKGQTIGLMGNTGRSTGPHVHFTIYYNGVPQNPMNFIQ
jgi:LysM repeat protein